MNINEGKKVLCRSNDLEGFTYGKSYEVILQTQEVGGLYYLTDDHGINIYADTSDFIDDPREAVPTCTLGVKYFDKMLAPLEHNGDWVDLRVSYIDLVTPDGDFHLFDDTIPKGYLIKVYFGIGIELPFKHEAIIRPRGSLTYKTGLIWTCSGVVDEGYCGPDDQWFGVFYATRDTELKHNQRICQFRIQPKQPQLMFEETEFTSPNRGGCGSTGEF